MFLQLATLSVTIMLKGIHSDVEYHIFYKIFEFMPVIPPPPIFLDIFCIVGDNCCLVKSLKVLNTINISLLYLINYNQERHKSSLKVSAYLALENEWVRNGMSSLCTILQHLIAHTTLTFGKGYSCKKL